jgi:hypothetical protein
MPYILFQQVANHFFQSAKARLEVLVELFNDMPVPHIILPAYHIYALKKLLSTLSNWPGTIQHVHCAVAI